jgi:hypothetical protein
LSLECRAAPQAEVISTNFYGPAEGRLQAGRNPSLQAGVANEQRDSNVRKPEENEEQDDPFEPLTPTARTRMNRRERLRCCDALGKSV